MADLNAEYRVRLTAEFHKKCSKNSRYSQGAFAKFLGLDSTYISKLQKGKIILSLDLADKITKRLNLNEKERRDFLLSVAEEQECHALYLLDPSLTDCDPRMRESNSQPANRRKKD